MLKRPFKTIGPETLVIPLWPEPTTVEESERLMGP